MNLRSSLAVILFPSLLFAQPSVDVQQAFLDLTHDGVLMCVSAHPDDEDGATLAYYRMKYGVKTYSVFLTRGEGGQNEKGPELYEDLGVLRTAETEAAGRIQGTQVFFLNFKDFGYSKSATEAFQKWGRREVLRRLVFIIRKLKPDVLFSSLNTIDGHGHHQAAVVTAIAAFDAAADSTFAPEQLRLPGVALWQPKKLFIRSINRPDIGLSDWGRYDVVNEIGEVNEPRHMAYVDIATQALRMHKTQGMDRADLRRFSRGRSFYRLIRASSLFERDTTTFFSGIDFWNDYSVQGLIPIRTHLSSLRQGMPRDSVLLVASSLLGQIDSVEGHSHASPLAQRLLLHWSDELQRVVELSCNVGLSFTFADSVVVPRQKVNCILEVRSPECKITGVRCELRVPDGWVVDEAAGRAPSVNPLDYVHDFTLTVGEAPVFTLPKARAQYRPIETEQNVKAVVRCFVSGYPFVLTCPAHFDVAPVQTLEVAPEVTRIAPSLLGKGKEFAYTIRNYRPGSIAGKVTVQGPQGWTAEFPTYRIENEDSSTSGLIRIHPAKDTKPGEYVLKFRTEYQEREAIVRVFDVAVARGLKIGIIKSYDNTLEDASSEIGVDYHLMDTNELQHGNLLRFSTILVDIRAYLVREDLRAQNSRLLQYVKDGGNLVVMYQRPQEWKPEYAPYPFQISGKRVTDEDAPISILDPQHPLLNHPNRIVNGDWLGWKQERAIYFPTDVPSQYVPLLSSHDPDEAPLTTGYIVARYGKGSYIYTSYVWYRQLKEVNPGAFRCFANMISYPAHRD